MNDEWLEWTRLNLARGCDPDEIRERLERQNYSAREIAFAMSGRESSWQRDLAKIDYAAIASPPLVSEQRARRHGDDRLQLYVIDEFLSRQQCAQLCRLIDTNLRPSTITTGPDDYGFRTSSTCFLGHETAPLVGMLDDKIAATLGVDLAFSESIQGQKYAVGEEFKAHTDYFEPNTLEYEEYAGAKGQRTWTFMVYLNDTPAGGGTDFTAVGSCFQPCAGQALIWNNLYADGRPNPYTIHHGMPVEDGEKFIITKWFRDRIETVSTGSS